MIHDRLHNASLYFSTPTWTQVIDFLRQLPADVAEGRITLQGEDLFANVMSYRTGPAADALLETHDDFIDVQMSLAGTEVIGWYPRAALTVQTPYNPERDCTFYHRPDIAPLAIIQTPGRFSVFLPEDGHCAKLVAAGSAETVKKVVVKVRKTLLGL